VVSKANQWAKDHGKTPFCIYQGNWSILSRSFERDIIPMARSEGLALAPWGVVGGGRIITDAEEQQRRQSGEGGRTIITSSWERTPDEVKVSKKLEDSHTAEADTRASLEVLLDVPYKDEHE